MSDYRRNDAWQLAHQLALVTYKITADFPDTERYGLVVQMRRAAVSVVSNIAEGISRRHSNRDLAHFLRIAAGSAAELEYQGYLAAELNLITTQSYDAFHDQCVATRQCIAGFIRWAQKHA